jgi:hypothetical protein
MYIGNNDWNLYCFSDYVLTRGTVSAALDKTEIQQGDSVVVSGQLSPPLAYVPITVSLIKPDGATTELEIIAQNDGTFSFNCTPDSAGQWAVSVDCSGTTYEMQSADLPLVVVDDQGNVIPDQTQPETEGPADGQGIVIPFEFFVVFIVALIVVVGVVVYSVIRKRNRHKVYEKM